MTGPEFFPDLRRVLRDGLYQPLRIVVESDLRNPHQLEGNHGVYDHSAYIDTVRPSFLCAADQCMENGGATSNTRAGRQSVPSGTRLLNGSIPIVRVWEDRCDGLVVTHRLSVSHGRTTALLPC